VRAGLVGREERLRSLVPGGARAGVARVSGSPLCMSILNSRIRLRIKRRQDGISLGPDRHPARRRKDAEDHTMPVVQ
jgi:hypothetical protein